MTDIGLVSPTSTDNVRLTTATRDANGLPTSPSLVWSLTPDLVGSLVIAPDSLSALYITPDGEFSVTITATTTDGVADQCEVSRVAGVTTVIGLAAELVPKA